MFSTRIKHGINGGIMGGLVFGMMMAKMGTLPMIGGMIGLPHVAAGFLVHMMISVSIGASFGLLLGPWLNTRGKSLAFGAAYGASWWVLGPLTLMPLMMGMGLGVNWNATAAAAMLPSLMGHVVFGLVMGFAYSRGDSCFLNRRRKTPAPQGTNAESVSA